MVRNYSRKTNRGGTPKDVMWRAVNSVISNHQSIRQVASEYGICHVTLYKYVKMKREMMKANNDMGEELAIVGYAHNRQIFSDRQEVALEQYLKHAADIFFGLSPKEVRSLAYDCAKEYKIDIPATWIENKMAGRDWFTSFMKRHPGLSIRAPESTSLARATNFNEANTNLYFQKLGEVLERYKLEPKDIWNLDETGVTTVQKPRNIVASKGMKQVGAITSAERGQLVTVCGAVSAIGNSIPPMFIFPRRHFKDHFIRDGPTGSCGTANPSGWMNEESFVLFLQHFVSNVHPNKDHPVLMILDNHSSHTSVSALDYAKENGIVFLSFPPHCTHRLQPLDVAVYGPLKTRINVSQDAWMKSHPGKTMTIYDIPGVVKEAWPASVTPRNIMKGFEVTGICPLNPAIFQDCDFAPSYVTDQPPPDGSTPNASGSISLTEYDAEHCQPSAEKLLDDQPACPVSNPPNTISLTEDQDILGTYITNKGRKILAVKGDGHCLIHAACASLKSEGIADITHEKLSDLCSEEIHMHWQDYKHFSPEDEDILDNFHQYIKYKKYNTNTGDLVLSIICNAMSVSATLYMGLVDGPVVEVVQEPRQSTGGIFLALTGYGLSAHYNAVVAQSNEQPSASSTSDNFSPEIVRPFPKATRTKCNKGRKKRKAAILTDTPEKMALAEEQDKRKDKKIKDKNGKQKSEPDKKENGKSSRRLDKATKKINKQKTIKRKLRYDQDSSDDDESFCLVCMEPYTNSKAGEQWIQCVMCKGWSHEECIYMQPHGSYICQNCDSDDSDYMY